MRRAGHAHNGGMKNTLLVLVWLAFTAYSAVIAWQHGIFGFVALAGREPWGLQMLLDLFLALSLFAGFVIKDAKERGLRAWPWILAMFALGSIGALPYLVHRRGAVARG